MRMMPLADYLPEPGELIEFRPKRTAPRPDTALVHPAPPSYLQENHFRRLLANQAAGTRHSPWIGLTFDLPGTLDTQAMAAAFTAWVRRHPTLLTWFTPDGDRWRRWAVPGQEFTVKPVPHGRYDWGPAIRDWLLKRFETGTSPLDWPPFTAGAVVRDGGVDAVSTIWFAVDHSHSDGYSLMLAFGELRELYKAELAGTRPALPSTGSYTDFCALDRERAARIGADAAGVQRWIDFFGAGPLPPFPLDLGTKPGTLYPTAHIELELFDQARADAFAKACTARGAGFWAGMLAALGIAGYVLGGPAEYRALAVVHTRDERRWQHAHGWFIAHVPVAFDAAGTFAEVLVRAQRAIDDTRYLSGVPPLRVLELLPAFTGTVQADAAAVPPIVSYLDCRHAPGSRDWAAANCNGLVGPGSSREVPLWINRLWDRTYIKAEYPDTGIARENVSRFLARLRTVLRDIGLAG